MIKIKDLSPTLFWLTTAILTQNVFNKRPWRPYRRIVAILNCIIQHKIWILDDNIINFIKLCFLTIWCLLLKQIVAFPVSLCRPSWRLVAKLELSEHSNSICIINSNFYIQKYISYLKKNINLFTVCCPFTERHYMIGDGGRLGYWQPYWKDLNIGTI